MSSYRYDSPRRAVQQYTCPIPSHTSKLLTPHQGTAFRGTSQISESEQSGKAAKSLHIDGDQRLRRAQQELDRVAHNSNPGINSSVLHGAPQHYPTSTLRLELEAEIDRLLQEQVSKPILYINKKVYPVVRRLLKIRALCNILTKFNVDFKNSLQVCCLPLRYRHDNQKSNREILLCRFGTCLKFGFLFLFFSCDVSATCYTEQQHCSTRTRLARHSTPNTIELAQPCSWVPHVCRATICPSVLAVCAKICSYPRNKLEQAFGVRVLHATVCASPAMHIAVYAVCSVCC